MDNIQYGVHNEKKARDMYEKLASREHDNLVVKDSGLVIDVTFPLFSASPDGVRTCSCHGDGLIEIKCCASHRDMEVSEIPNVDKNFYLEPVTLKLRESHRYYTQIQFQMFVCNKEFCDFVVYTDKGIFYQTIY